MRSMTTAALLAGLVCAAPSFGADANAGKAVFRAQCALCHSAEPGDNGGGQGPNLNGVFGRHAASTDFGGYTAALKGAGLTWDAATLDRFLTSPTTVVPGSAMVIPVPDNTERSNLIAYFQAVKDGTFKPVTPNFARGPGPGGPPPPAPGSTKPVKGFDDWTNDVPGRAHRIDLFANFSEICGLLLIRLFQEATTGSMNECLGRDFPKACGIFNRSMLPKKHANSIWPPAVGRMASCVRNAETDAPMN